MKKIISAALAAVMCLGLASCGNDAQKSEAGDKTYIIYSDNSFAPFEYLDSETNTYVGVDMDILAAVAADQGFKYEVKNEGFDASMGAVQSGQADAMIAGMTINEEREKTFDFSDGYFEDGQILVVAKDSKIEKEDDLKGTSVATKIGTMGTEYAESIKDTVGFDTVNYEDSPTMYTALENGTNAACFEDRSVVEWAIKAENLNLKTVGEVINPKQYGFAVRKGENAELIKMFNEGLKNIKESGKYDEILAKYGY